MNKIKLNYDDRLSLKDGCEKYLEDCRIRNLREGTINHYRQAYLMFYKYVDNTLDIRCFNEDIVGGLVEIYPKEDDEYYYIVYEEGLLKEKEFNKLAQLAFDMLCVGDVVVIKQV